MHRRLSLANRRIFTGHYIWRKKHCKKMRIADRILEDKLTTASDICTVNGTGEWQYILLTPV